jgi:hypothetical protein
MGAMAKKDNPIAHLPEIAGNQAIFKEIRDITARINPCFDFIHTNTAFDDVEKLFRGKYPGYRECNTPYHDFRHTVRKRGRFYLILFNKQNFHTCPVYMQ